MNDKYFVRMRIDSRIYYKKNKCVDGWSMNKQECWAFTRPVADRLVKAYYRQAQGKSKAMYDFIRSNGEGKNEWHFVKK